jgi:hypothetical protein
VETRHIRRGLRIQARHASFVSADPPFASRRKNYEHR